MDTSKEFINQCREAKEVQELWVPAKGDWIWNLSATPKYYIFVNYLYQPWYNSPEWELMVPVKRNYLIFLPTQSQLQSLTVPYLTKDYTCLGYDWKSRPHIAYYWCFKYWFEAGVPEEYVRQLNSTEQLQLSFFMYVAFNKRWSGAKWEAIS